MNTENTTQPVVATADNTRTVTLPSGKVAVFKGYITARDRNTIQDIISSKHQVSPEGGAVPLEHDEIDTQTVRKMINAMIVASLVEYDGSKENIFDRLLDGAPDDYDAAYKEAERTYTGGFTPAK